MYTYFILLLSLSFLISIHSQPNDERNLPPERYNVGRSSNVAFDAQFRRGQCPKQFYQLGEECLYFSNDGKVYSWKQAEIACSGRVARIANQKASQANNQPILKPILAVRQLTLNTPEKTDIFRAISREYDEQNFAVRLPSDYNTLQRCNDGKDDKWPQYCQNPRSSNSTCFETVSQGPNGICLREVGCRQEDSRLACEFTLPGSLEITTSRFRQCPKTSALRRRLPIWAWIVIACGSSLLIIILASIIIFIRNKKQNSSPKKSLPLPRQPNDRVIRVSTVREDPAAQPMLHRASPTDTGYIQPRSTFQTTTDNTENT